MMLSVPAIIRTNADAQKRLLSVSPLQSSHVHSRQNGPISMNSQLEASARILAQALGNATENGPGCSTAPGSELGDLTPLTWLPTFRVAEVENQEDENASRSDESSQPESDVSPQNALQAPAKAKARPPGKPRTTRMSTKSPDKPRYSFANLIFMAIENSESKCLPVKAIYDWILHHFPYYRVLDADPKRSCWRNSVRHNLSLNPAFMKMLPSEGGGKKNDNSKTGKHSCKGAFWVVNPAQRESMMQALVKSGPLVPGLFPSVDSQSKTWSAASGGGIENEIATAMLEFRYAKYGRPKAVPVDRPLSCPPSLNENEYMSSKATRCILRDMDVRPHGQTSTAHTGCEATGLNAVAEAACQAQKVDHDTVEEKFLSRNASDDEMDKGDNVLEDSGFNGSAVDSPPALATGGVDNDEEVAAKSLMFLAAQAHSTSHCGRKHKHKRGRPKKQDLPPAKKVCPSPRRLCGSSRRKVKKPARYIADYEISPFTCESPSKDAKRTKKVDSSSKYH